MKKIINCCGNCPFLYSDYDDFAIGNSTAEICTLAKFKDLKEYFILLHDGEDEIKTPKWCPLKSEEEHIFKFRNFSEERQEKIDSTIIEIGELSEFVDEYIGDYEHKDYVKKFERLSKLYYIISDLYQNEEFFEEEFTNDINKSVSEITEQLNELEKATLKINETFNNLGNENN